MAMVETVSPVLEQQPSDSITVFLKCEESVKRYVLYADATFSEIATAFFTKFPKIRAYHSTTRPVFTMVAQESQDHIEIGESPSLYANCMIHYKVPADQLRKSQPKLSDATVTSVGYFAFQKQKLAFVMVGLPGRGKSFIARKIYRYLNWVGVPRAIFNVSDYRRSRLGHTQKHDFFNPENSEGHRALLHMAIAALDEMLNWLNQGGRVALYDGTNTTKDRRDMILRRCEAENVQVVFVESICPDAAVVEKNIQDTKYTSPDYANVDPEEAARDFRQRIANYEKTYQTVGDDQPYVKIMDLGRQVIVNRIESYVASRVIHFLMNLHISPRPIYITLHGQSEYNISGKLGGDPALTPMGDDYAHAVADWVEQNVKSRPLTMSMNKVAPTGLTVWTSTAKRAVCTAQYINHPKLSLRSLDDMDVGMCDSMSQDEIAEAMPDEFAARAANRLRYRYPKGESYMDVMARLEPVIFELERHRTPVLIVAHKPVCRALYKYFMDIDLDDYPFIPLKQHTIYEFVPMAYGCTVKAIKLPVKTAAPPAPPAAPHAAQR
eukprot:TRINITY_DN8849_c0_g1_i1.p1 TRINITY_DN8849_c0_g1~~TRINITY_DN8849_c0_g1_i1.p1  ORF type:complete len:550 (+),score=189.67 TRINITY_DN8849_c0_g1_i1:200-1849(+)